MVRATDTDGQFVETTFTVTVNPVNDTPTTTGIADVTVDEDAADSVVDLFAAFADIEDADAALTYSITGNTNVGLFTATAIDGVAGTLTLDYAANQNGTADITVRATDTGGLRRVYVYCDGQSGQRRADHVRHRRRDGR